jgi:hypothetical protein
MRVVLLILTVFIASCSWNTRFAISNKMDSDITVRVHSKPYLHAQTKERICSIVKWPRLQVTDDYLWYFNSGEWKDLPSDRQYIDESNCSIEFSLYPGESVVIANGGTYTGARADEDVIDVASITITSESKTISYSGIQLLAQFKKIDDMLYVLKVKKI